MKNLYFTSIACTKYEQYDHNRRATLIKLELGKKKMVSMLKQNKNDIKYIKKRHNIF